MIVDNERLVDLHFLLEIQSNAVNGTLVMENPILCISPPISWAEQSNSLISYNYGQVC